MNSDHISLGYGVKSIKFIARTLHKFTSNNNENKHKAKWLRKEIGEMGPVYIKIGQIISTRTDIFPKYITKELSNLQNNMSYMDYTDVEDIFFNEFHNPIDFYFSSFEEKPIAAASIGQVHIGTLKNENVKIALKIQRKDIDKIFINELSTILLILFLIRSVVINKKQYDDVILILQELLNNIENETDFGKEKESMILFHELFKHNEKIIVPRVYGKLSSTKVLAMEYVNSAKITDTIVNDQTVAYTLMSAFVKNVIDTGYIHCDPHPGNIGITEDKNIVLYDYGMITKFNGDMREYFKKMFFAIINKSTDEFISFMLSSDMIIPTESNAKTIEDLTAYEYFVFERLIGYIYIYVYDLDAIAILNKLNTDDIIDINDLPFTFDTQMIYMFKSFSTLEGVCKQIYDDFNYADFMSEIFFDFIDSDMIIDKMIMDIKKTSDGVMSPKKRENENNYLKLNFERMEKKMKNDKKVSTSLLVALTIYILFLI